MKPKKMSFVYIMLLTSIGCASRTEFGRRRLGKLFMPVISNDNRVYSLIDTTKLYEIASAVETPTLKPLTSVNKIYLRFYAGGRMGTFYNPGLLDPKRADIGYYEYNGGDILMRSFFEHPQGGGWIKGQVLSFLGDTLLVTSGKILTKYRPLPIPTLASISRPDW